MSLNTADAALREFSFSDEDFRALARMARTEFGLSLADSKKPLVYSRLARRLRARKVPGFQDYMVLLQQQNESEERLELISALTTNVTSFFREKHHFETLENILKPDVYDGRRFRIWSAGCSSGQEPYSIAMTLLNAHPDAASKDMRVLATDIDPIVVKRARAGRYSQEERASIPEPTRTRWTDIADDASDLFTIKSDAQRLITFGELNLMEGWPFKGPFDAIFCRNVAIYFDQETQQALWSRFADMLKEGGTLFIGHSERISGPALNQFQTAGVTTYRKTAKSGGAISN